jgi:two-component system sensor histidine kinase ChvG
MASDTDSPTNDEEALRWRGRWSLAPRILAVNVFALLALASTVVYLDSYRSQLIQERGEQFNSQALVMAAALAATPVPDRPRLAAVMGQASGDRLRIYDQSGRLTLDSWAHSSPTYKLRDPATQSWRKHVARFLDRALDTIVATTTPPRFIEPDPDVRQAWPEVEQAATSRKLASRVRSAPERTPVFSAATPLSANSTDTLFLTLNARDVIRNVRAERFWLGVVIIIVIALSMTLSLFLARTIVLPLRRLALAAERVRLGRAREVVVPRLPSRRDEIGTLARALSDMSQALRHRIDATEAFAADVTHELKNPLASLRSAVDTMQRIDDPALQQRLIEVIQDDVRRLDRLITDIAEASRLDAELSRARFEPIDLGPLVETLVTARELRGIDRGVRLAFGRPRVGTAVVMGDESRLARVIENLLDNALSFSPPGGLVEISPVRVEDEVLLRIDDEGPGVAPEAREEIFDRFHSVRPEGEAFGRHSGLGLAIAKAIVEGHNGRIEVLDRNDAASGARFVIHLPAVIAE